MARRINLPLVYSCSGCSSAAQLANHLAIRLDRAGKAEMSCIAGVGGDVPSLVRVATSGRPIVAIDGCALKCVQSCLVRHGVQPTIHYDLTQFGVKKRFKTDFAPDQAGELFERIAEDLSRRFTARSNDDGSVPVKAFSSEVDTGSHEENASKQESRASVLIQSEPKL